MRKRMLFSYTDTMSNKVGYVETNPSLNERDSNTVFVDLETSNGEDTADEIFRTGSTTYIVVETDTLNTVP